MMWQLQLQSVFHMYHLKKILVALKTCRILHTVSHGPALLPQCPHSTHPSNLHGTVWRWMTCNHKLIVMCTQVTSLTYTRRLSSEHASTATTPLSNCLCQNCLFNKRSHTPKYPVLVLEFTDTAIDWHRLQVFYGLLLPCHHCLFLSKICIFHHHDFPSERTQCVHGVRRRGSRGTRRSSVF